MTEHQLKEKNIPYEKATFPWQANGRALVTRSLPGLTKVLFDPSSQRIIGAGILGAHAGDLIGEMSLAIEMGAVITDLALTIHPHPTFIESLGLACELGEGTITDLIAPLKKAL
jgi:dihydrolipoamide dehydrogenase